MTAEVVVRVRCRSGKELEIPCHHAVFTPVGDYQEGDVVDPSTVRVETDRAPVVLERGRLIIVDNRVEVVERVGLVS